MTDLASSIFTRTNHLFLRNPHGGVEGLAEMAASGFGAVFCNIADYALTEWDLVRSRAVAAGVTCGPWARVAEGGSGAFDPERLGRLLDVADEWGTPLIVNAESELKGSGSEITEFIADEVADRDAAVSMEPWPFANVDWRPIGHLPILPQIFGAQWGADADDAREEWFRCGAECVVSTFGTYGGTSPDAYDRLSPYGCYTADDCGNNFVPWEPLGVRSPYPPDGPANGGDGMEMIGSQHGVTASLNRLRTIDPGGTLLTPDASGKWPPLSTLAGTPVDKWRAYDKLERALTILVSDHDAQVTQ